VGGMASRIEQLTEQALELSESERAGLAHRLLLSLDEPKEEGVEEAWEAEIARRVEQVKNGTAKGRPAEDVLRDIRARLQ
jgi:putative addiction module component (TIGR02574 family)